MARIASPRVSSVSASDSLVRLFFFSISTRGVSYDLLPHTGVVQRYSGATISGHAYFDEQPGRG